MVLRIMRTVMAILGILRQTAAKKMLLNDSTVVSEGDKCIDIISDAANS